MGHTRCDIGRAIATVADISRKLAGLPEAECVAGSCSVN